MKLWSRSVAVAACLMVGVVGPAAPAFADDAVLAEDPSAGDGAPFELVDGSDTAGEVTARGAGLYRPTTGDPAGSIQPGQWFYVKFTLTSHAEREAKVTGVESRLWTTVHPDLQAEYPIDYCDQFLESRERVPGNPHVNLPDYDALFVAPGETTAELDDDREWRMRGGAGNACQRLTFYWGGTPSYEFGQPVEPVAVTPNAPVWEAGHCDASTPIAGSVRIFSTEGVRYTLNGEPIAPGKHEIPGSGPAPGTPATVSALAEDGFVFEEGTAAEWSQGFPELQCEGGVVPPTPDPGGDPDPEPSPNPNPNPNPDPNPVPGQPAPQPAVGPAGPPHVLAQTGSATGTAALGLGALLAAAGIATAALTRVRARRHS